MMMRGKREMESEDGAMEMKMAAAEDGLAAMKMMMMMNNTLQHLAEDDPLIVPQYESSYESLYLEGSALAFGDSQEAGLASAGSCGDAGEFTRLFKLEDLLALEGNNNSAGEGPARVLQQGPGGLFDWFPAPLDLKELCDLEQDDSPVGSAAVSRMPSPSPSPSPAPAAAAAAAAKSRKRKAAPVTEIPTMPPKKRVVGVVMDDEERRERNRLSALKYRQKRRNGAFVTEDRIEELERENQLLHFEVMKEKQALAELRALMIKHGLPLE